MYGVSDPFDPISSIWGGAAHFSYMMSRAKKLVKYAPEVDPENIALTMYNMGETAYRAALRSGKALPREAHEYAAKVRAAAGAKLTYHCNNKSL
jgi:membrane-bound lytic murein transglycosylase MltF